MLSGIYLEVEFGEVRLFKVLAMLCTRDVAVAVPVYVLLPPS